MIKMFEDSIEKEKLGLDDAFIQFLQDCGVAKQTKNLFETKSKIPGIQYLVLNEREVKAW